LSNLKKQVGSRVREIRKRNKLTQTILAQKVHLSVNMIGYIERGERFPSPETFEKLAGVLDVPIRDLFSFPPMACDDDPEKREVMKELVYLIENSPTQFIKSVVEIIAASRNLTE
jgi:transcriptional regulator with XRE-family HTH domain